MTYDVGDVLLGIDPGTVSGWAVMPVAPNPRPLQVGKVDFAHPRRKEFRTASQVIRFVHNHWQLVLVAIEDQYLSPDPKKIASTIKLCRAAGRWIEAAEDHGKQWTMTNPTTWQTAILGRRMKREQLKKFSRDIARQRFGVDAPDHIADACHIAAYEAAVILDDRRAQASRQALRARHRRSGGDGARAPRRGEMPREK